MTAETGKDPRRIKRLAKRFHRVARSVRIPWRHRVAYWRAYIRLARQGTMIHSPTHDAVYEDGPLKRAYDAACERINARLEAAGKPPQVEVPSFEHGELALSGLQELMRRNVPFVIRDGARDLPAKNWTLEYLEQVTGSCEVPINMASDEPEADHSRPSKAHHYYDFKTGTVADVAASIRGGGNLRVSTAEDVMHHDGGRLRQELDLPYWEQVTGWEKNQHRFFGSRLLIGKVVSHQLMLQPENAFTLWHAEPGDNFSVLVKGTKTWTLAHPYYTAALRPRVKSTTNYHGSNVDIREPEEVQRQRGFGGYLGMPRVRVTMRAGDVLRVPHYWWHTVVTQPGEYTIAATVRSNGRLGLMGFGYTRLRWLDPQFGAIARAFAKEGRIHDRHIGYPRPPRASSSAGAAAEEEA